jgi:hypothetical protein
MFKPFFVENDRKHNSQKFSIDVIDDVIVIVFGFIYEF